MSNQTPNLKIYSLSDEVKIKLIVMVEVLKDRIADRINEKLKNGIKCEKIVRGSAILTFKLACSIEVIDKTTYDILHFLVKRRNEAAHNAPVDLDIEDFPILERVLPSKKVEEIKSLELTRDGHYIQILEAVDETINKAI